jgi:hypothetical protein
MLTVRVELLAEKGFAENTAVVPANRLDRRSDRAATVQITRTNSTQTIASAPRGVDDPVLASATEDRPGGRRPRGSARSESASRLAGCYAASRRCS